MRTIKFRFWDGEKIHYWDSVQEYQIEHIFEPDIAIWIPMQFTGLFDRSGLAEVYEGDIIDTEGIIKGNIYESPQIYKKGIDLLIEGMGTSAWRSTESIAMGLGCKYSE